MPDSSRSRPGDKRDRKSTEDSIIAAFETVLLRNGVAGLGINIVAAEAGVNKVLIYRYFGDLAGIAKRWVDGGSFWPPELELIGNDPEAFAALPVPERIATIMRNFVGAIRSRPRTVELLAAELLIPSDLSRALAEGLAKPGSGLSRYTNIYGEGPAFVEKVWQLTYMITAAIAYLAIRERSNPQFFRLDLTNDEAWKYFRDIVGEMTARFLKE